MQTCCACDLQPQCFLLDLNYRPMVDPRIWFVNVASSVHSQLVVLIAQAASRSLIAASHCVPCSNMVSAFCMTCC